MKINYVFWMLQISCSTVGSMLDIILKQESLIIGSAYGKKKKKLNVHCRSSLPHNVICKGEDALSLLSSVFDILLLKKDIANRSAFLNASNSGFRIVMLVESAEYLPLLMLMLCTFLG